MHRLTARILLLLVASGASAPMLAALSAQPPHACCLRKMHASSGGGSGLHEAAVHQGNCCPPMTTPHSAQLSAQSSVWARHSAAVAPAPADQYRATACLTSRFSRAPPILS
jgi:hypothetical protein